MKRFARIFSLTLCAAVLMSLPAMAAEKDLLISPAPAIESLAPVRAWGKVTKLESGSLLLRTDDETALHKEIVVHLPEGVPCVDAVTGLPMDMSKVKDGDTLYAWVGNAMTMSLPPQTSALIVVGNIPADYKVPEFYKVIGTDQTVMPAIYPAPERTEVNLPVAGGETLTIPVSAQFTPWLTRQMVTVDNLVPGSQILVWKDKDGKVEKVLLLPYAYRGYYTMNDKGEVTVNGEKLSVNAKLSDPNMLPLRAVAEAVNYDVTWVGGQGATVKEGDKVIFSVLPGAGTAKRPNVEDGDWELLTPCVTEMGVTYLAASDLSLLLDLYFYNT
ncbi:hypothetical protein [Oscillibacter sp.]|jgi:hypothetical protein|uniref:hypothetical protein n=1 Tax=Oscillibacter sp. TaxID=1945593 RepID=UPI00216E493F|nr:hypothetical protein [Oscillibacter sp.]MCI9650073.1 hypothetical protein [Oscillibacter sp.]